MELSIKPVSARNRKQVLELSLAESQKGFVESPRECLREARRLWLWRPVAILDADVVVGFAMYGKFPHDGERGRVWLDRFLIDERYQGRGYGRKALSALCGRLRETYGCDEIYLSCYPENQSAIRLYQRAGFQRNGEKDINGEDVMVLTCGGTMEGSPLEER